MACIIKKKERDFFRMNHKTYEPADLLIYVSENEKALKEISLVAFDEVTQKILGYGVEAKRIGEQAANPVRVISPLRQGRIADYMASVEMFSYFLKQSVGKKRLRRPAVAVCMPKDLTEVEKKALEDCIIQSGAREIKIFDKFPEKPSELNKQFQVVIEITKEEPEAYIAERLKEVLEYAAGEGISGSRVEAMLQKGLDKA